jgi:antitoxin CcdA
MDPLKKKRAVNLTIRQDILKEAKELKLNTSQAAEDGIRQAIRKEKEAQWLKNNRKAIEAYNERIEREGVLIKPYWMEE